LDKGHQSQFKNYLQSIEKEGKSLIEAESLINTTQASFAALQSLENKAWVAVG
jgi:hypothetical protein